MNGSLATKSDCATKLRKERPGGIYRVNNVTRRTSHAIYTSDGVSIVVSGGDTAIRPYLRSRCESTHSASAVNNRQHQDRNLVPVESRISGRNCRSGRLGDMETVNVSNNDASCYMWLLPRRNPRQLNKHPGPVTKPPISLNLNSRTESCCVPSQYFKETLTHSRLHDQREMAESHIPHPSWQILSRKQFEKQFPNNRSMKPSLQSKAKRNSEPGTSMSSLRSNRSRFFSCPSCLGDSDSERSDSSSSEEDDGGSDTENDEGGERNDDDGIANDDPSYVTDAENSSGGSDSASSNESLAQDRSIDSSIYDEDIMINEEKAYGDIGQFDSDDELDFEGVDGNHAISSDSFTDSDEFFRDSDDERRNTFRDVDHDTYGQYRDNYDSD